MSVEESQAFEREQKGTGAKLNGGVIRLERKIRYNNRMGVKKNWSAKSEAKKEQEPRERSEKWNAQNGITIE